MAASVCNANSHSNSDSVYYTVGNTRGYSYRNTNGNTNDTSVTANGHTGTECNGGTNTKCDGSANTKCDGSTNTKCDGSANTKCDGSAITAANGISDTTATEAPVITETLANGVKKGKVLKDSRGSTFKVTGADAENPEVCYEAPAKKAKGKVKFPMIDRHNAKIVY